MYDLYRFIRIVLKNIENILYERNSLGILLIALNGRRTRIVRIADKLKFSVSRPYSKQLKANEEKNHKGTASKTLHLHLKNIRRNRLLSDNTYISSNGSFHRQKHESNIGNIYNKTQICNMKYILSQ